MNTDALDTFGSLYRNEDGIEVWRITDAQGRVIAEDIDSDHDARFIAESVIR